jgi:hypothetical protein
MPNRELLESYPLYRRMEVQTDRTMSELPKPPVTMSCPTCGSVQTFRMVNEYHQCFMGRFPLSRGATVHAVYLCTSCDSQQRVFFVLIGEHNESLTKVGQFPPWDIHPDPVLEASLGAHAEHYRRGLVCESQAYGIGACAYYRRIVESIIDQLLDDIAALIPPEQRERYEEALLKSKEAKITSDKIELVKDLLPPILRPNGMNPLSTLHDALSEGLHISSDQDCMSVAETIRTALVFLVNQVETTKSSAKQFTTSLQKLLDRKAKRAEGSSAARGRGTRDKPQQ